MHIEHFYKWSQRLEKPPLEFLPKVLENLVHSYLKPTIADGMQHLAYKYKPEIKNPCSQNKKKKSCCKNKNKNSKKCQTSKNCKLGNHHVQLESCLKDY